MALWPSNVLYPAYADQQDSPIADLDLATGITRYFYSVDEFTELIRADASRLDEDGRYLLEAITHETIHLLQLVQFGFCYSISANLFRIVADAARSHGSLDAINDNRSKYSGRFERVFDRLKNESIDGITPLSIMESAAFLGQKLDHYQLGPRSFEELLEDEAPSGDYRIAYDVACEYLGPDALELFPHVASLALTTIRPEDAFISLLSEFREHASRADTFHNHRIGMAVLGVEYKGGLLGSGADQVSAGNEHPILARMVQLLAVGAGNGDFDSTILSAKGRPYNSAVAESLRSLSVFMPSASTAGKAPLLLPPDWDVLTGADPLLEPETMKYFHAVSVILQQDLVDIEPTPLVLPSVSAGSRQLDLPFIFRNGIITRENRTTETAKRLAELLEGIGSDSKKARALRGTMTITFPDVEFPGVSPLLDVEVQAFLREVFTRAPYILYYLADAPELSAILEVVAAFLPHILIPRGDGSFEVGFSPDLLTGVTQMLLNAAGYAASHDDSPKLVLNHLNAFPEEIGGALRQVVSDAIDRSMRRA